MNANNPAASLIYNFPNVSANSDVVLTNGLQMINGVKTFTSVSKWYASYLQMGSMSCLDNIVQAFLQYVPSKSDYTLTFQDSTTM